MTLKATALLSAPAVIRRKVADWLLLNELTVHAVVPEHDADRYLDVARARRLADAGNADVIRAGEGVVAVSVVSSTVIAIPLRSTSPLVQGSNTEADREPVHTSSSSRRW